MPLPLGLGERFSNRGKCLPPLDRRKMTPDKFLSRYGFARSDVALGNWRTRPYSTWSFQNVSEMVPTAEIATSATIEHEVLEPLGPLLDEAIAADEGEETVLGFLDRSSTDTLTIMKSGRFVGEYASHTADPNAPHIVFSISKSLTAILAGVLQGQKQLDPTRLVTHYLPEAGGSAYADATVQQVLDMRVSVDFVEAYLDQESLFARYRRAMLWNLQRSGESIETLREVIIALRKKPDEDHGGPFRYCSPGSDLLGMIVERVAGMRYTDFFREQLWIPLRAKGRCSVTVDGEGTARAAGGVCLNGRDLARIGEMMRNGGMAGSHGIVTEGWVRDTIQGGDRKAWRTGDFSDLFAHGSYRNKWYQTGYASGAFAAIGIHGQWLYVDPTREVVIVQMASRHEPEGDAFSQQILRFFQQVAEMV
jgi:CubicO group peptidase (beta-lactamase class C family)